MKQREQLFVAISDLSDDMILAAAPGKPRRKRAAWRQWIPAAACFCLAAVLGVAAWQTGLPKKVGESVPPVGTEDTEIGTAVTVPATEAQLIPKWVEMTDPERYLEFAVGEDRYHTRVAAIDAARVGEKLGEATVLGYDIYTDTTHETTVSYYDIPTVLNACALAVRFEGSEEYFVYANYWYRPETLGELIEALSLRENMTFGDFHAGYFYEDGTFEQVRFHDPEDGIVWEWLLSDTSLPNVYDEVGWYGSVLSVSVDIPLIGYENVGLWVTEDGHLVTNILDTGKAFYIGEEKVSAFVRYVTEHCTDRTVTVWEPMRQEGAETAVEEWVTGAMTTKAQEAPEEGTVSAVTSAAREPMITTSEE